MIKSKEIEYLATLQITKCCARHYVSNKYPERKAWIKLYLPKIFEKLTEEGDFDFNELVYTINFLSLLERNCLEVRLNHLRIKGRCKPIKESNETFDCILQYITDYMFYLSQLTYFPDQIQLT